MTTTTNPQPHPDTWRRLSLRFLILAALIAISVEVAFRLFMAIQLGPRALLYGTPWFRQEISVGRMRHAEWRGPHGPEVADRSQSPSHHADLRAGYSKYFPFETKVDVDDAGEHFSYRLNGKGMRGQEFEIRKPPGVIRVVTLGGSSTYGFNSRRFKPDNLSTVRGWIASAFSAYARA